MATRFPRIGELRQRITVQTRADQESGLYSGISTRSTSFQAWAKIENISGVQQTDSRNAGTAITHRIWIRWRNDVDVQLEVLYTGRSGDTYRYAIQTVQNVGDERERFLLLECLQMAESDTLDNPSPESLFEAISDATFDSQMGSNGSDVSGVWAVDDGLTVFGIVSNQDYLTRHTISTAWDLGTASTTEFVQLNPTFNPPVGSSPADCAFSDTGETCWVLDTGQREIWEYSLGTGFDLSTVESPANSSGNILSSFGYIPSGFSFANNGNGIVLSESGSGNIHYHALTTAYDVSTMQAQTTCDASANVATATAVYISDNGRNMEILDSTGSAIEDYSLSSPFNISTASHRSTLDLSAKSNNASCMYVNEGYLIVGDRDDNEFYQYSFG